MVASLNHSAKSTLPYMYYIAVRSESLQLQVVQAKAETKYAIKEAERAKEAPW